MTIHKRVQHGAWAKDAGPDAVGRVPHSGLPRRSGSRGGGGSVGAGRVRPQLGDGGATAGTGEGSPGGLCAKPVGARAREEGHGGQGESFPEGGGMISGRGGGGR